jgi:hypothetical protein
MHAVVEAIALVLVQVLWFTISTTGLPIQRSGFAGVPSFGSTLGEGILDIAGSWRR